MITNISVKSISPPLEESYLHRCNTKSRAKKKTSIHSVPPILTIHLKRFSPNGLRKNTQFIQYPETLDLNPYLSDDVPRIPRYRLIATVSHLGFDLSGMSVGHYTANCKSASGTWNNFDDVRVESQLKRGNFRCRMLH
jgi:ubiquitin carboxyl-terminal hydrolase 36/42